MTKPTPGSPETSWLGMVLVGFACLELGIVGAVVYRDCRHALRPWSDVKADDAGHPERPAEKTGKPPRPVFDRFGDPLPAGAVARLGSVRFRHGSPIAGVAISPDGRYLASFTDGGSLITWEADSGREFQRFAFGGENLNAVCFAKNGAFLAARGSETIYLIDWPGGTRPRALPAPRNQATIIWEVGGIVITGSPLAISPDNKCIAVAGEDHRVYLLDMTSGKDARRFEGHRDTVRGLAFSPDGKYLVSGGMDQSVRVWSVVTGNEAKNVRAAGEVWYLAVSRDGKSLAASVSGAWTPKVQRWELPSCRELPAVGVPHGSISLTPDGNLLAGAGLWDVRTGKLLRRFPVRLDGHQLSDDGKMLVWWSKNAFRLFDVETARERKAFPGHEGEPTCLAFTADGRRLLSGCDVETSVRVWDPDTGEEKARWERTPVRGFLGLGGEDVDRVDGPSALALSPDGKTLVAGHGLSQATVHLWDATAGKELHGFSTGGPRISTLAFAPDGKTLAWADSLARVTLWDTAARKAVRTWQGPRGDAKALAFSPDGKALACVGGGAHPPGYDMRTWDVATGRERSRFEKNQEEVGAVALSPDARTTACAGDFGQPAVLFRDVATGEEVGRLEYRLLGRAPAFAPDGRSLAVATELPNEIQVYELATGKMRFALPGHREPATALAFSLDGNRLASAGRDTSILVWDLVGKVPAGNAPEDDLPSAWDALAEPDASGPSEAIKIFLRRPAEAVAFLGERLRPVASLLDKDREQASRWIAKLDSGDFEERESATKELEKLGGGTEALLHEALAKKPSPEARRRLRQLLDRLTPRQSPDWLRAVRSLEILERLSTPEARAVLQKLASGTPAARLTEESRATLGRLSARLTYSVPRDSSIPRR